MAARSVALAVGQFTGAAQQGAAVQLYGKYNFSLQFNAGTATARLVRSYDGGVSWVVTSKPDLSPAVFTGPVDVDGVGEEPETGMLYRWECTAFTSGPVNHRLSR